MEHCKDPSHYLNKFINQKRGRSARRANISGNSYGTKCTGCAPFRSTSRGHYMRVKHNMRGHPEQNMDNVTVKEYCGRKFIWNKEPVHVQPESTAPMPVPTPAPVLAKSVHLPEIHPSLYLGNRDSLSTMGDALPETCHIINLSGRPVKKQRNVYRHYVRHRRIHNITFRDSRVITGKMFRQTFQQIRSLLDSIRGDVLIICNKGVNRSVSMAIAYGICNGMTYDYAYEYIMRRKQEAGYDTWCCLTNLRFRGLLSNPARHGLVELIPEP